MAYLIGYLTEEQEAELERRGWELEAPPSELVDESNYADQREKDGIRMRMVWVDSDMFEIMDGPDWEKG